MSRMRLRLVSDLCSRKHVHQVSQAWWLERSLSGLVAGTISDGCFTPSGSVARYFWEKTRTTKPSQCKQKNIYFIQAGMGGPVKIGLARGVMSRLATLQTAHPHKLILLGTIQNGGLALERALHARFAD